ncbi:MAG: hypothetical protein PF482_20140 [Desulfobacteraceae bacterium]|jgi:predicted ATP-dependent Lon-type protease|nr:hypothetical protein [Desulfobacteraceae bacterium]
MLKKENFTAKAQRAQRKEKKRKKERKALRAKKRVLPRSGENTLCELCGERIRNEYDKDAVERCLVYALESRRRVKEQLKKIGGMEFYDVHFSYIDNESLEEKFVSVLEQGGGSLIPEGPMNSGTMHTVTLGTSEHLGLYRLELQITGGNGKLFDSGAKRILIPMSNVGDIPTISGELFAKFQTGFYSDPVGAGGGVIFRFFEQVIKRIS